MWSIADLCFMCSNDNKCNVVDNKIITQVEYLMPEIRIIKLKLPLRICSICEKNLQLFSTFKQDCVENSLRLEARIKEAQDNTDMTKKCSTPETSLDKIHEVYIKEEVVDESDNLDVYSLNEISIKEDPSQENSYDCEFGDILQDILKKESPQQIDTHLHESSSVDMDDKSGQNSDDPDDVFSDNKINSDKNILVTGSADCKIYTCLICKKSYKELSYLKIRHMKIHFGKKDFQCNECKKWFTYKSHLTRHMQQHTGVKDFQCNECKKRFTQKTSLTRHMTQHTGINDYHCNQCNKWFTRKSNFDIHMKVHTGVKNFQCNECKKWFSDKSYLVKHMKRHIGVKKFQCSECKKWFSQKSHLAAHIQRHRGIKKFQCNVCKKCFSQKSNLIAHMTQHTGIKDYQCNECKKWFTRKSTLVRHMNETH